MDERGQRIASLYRDHITRGRSEHRAAHWSLILPACFFGQSAVISASKSTTLASRPRCSIKRATAAWLGHALTVANTDKRRIRGGRREKTNRYRIAVVQYNYGKRLRPRGTA